MAHRVSQAALARAVGMSRTRIVDIENTPTWPREETRDRLHAFFGTSDEDLVDAGAARRKMYEVPGRPPQVVYEPTVRRGDPPPVEAVPSLEAVPPSIAEMLAGIRWTPETVQHVEIMLEGVASRQRRLSDAEAAGAPDSPRPMPARTPEQT